MSNSFLKKICSLITIGVCFFHATPGLALNVGDPINNVGNVGFGTKIIIGLISWFLLSWLFMTSWKTKPQTRAERRRKLRQVGYFKKG